MNREMLLNEIMALEFACLDLGLYLNTHPYDSKAIAHLGNMQKEAEEFKTEYEKQYGALSYTTLSNEDYYAWINEPWPWEKEYLGEQNTQIKGEK